MPRKYTNRTTHFILHDDGTFDVYINKKFKECGLYEETPDSVTLYYHKDSAIFEKEEGCLISENYRIWLEDRIINVPGGILNNGIFVADPKAKNDIPEKKDYFNEDYVTGSKVEEIIGDIRIREHKEERKEETKKETTDFTNSLIEGEKKETEG